MNKRTWVQALISIDERYQDLLIGQLALLGVTGFVQEAWTLQCIVPKQKWNAAFKNKFDSTLKKFECEFPSLHLSYSCEFIREENWNKQWEQRTGIVEATPGIIIKPSWKKLPRRFLKKLILHIDPKMSFGTGHHETTRLSLSLIERYLEPHMKVLDFGTGTGVLGIACIKLGASSVVALDNDEWSIENAKENVRRNRVQNQMSVALGSLSSIPRIKFDCIVANIDFRTISRFTPSLASRTRIHGIILFSGILASDLPALLKLFKKNNLVPLELIDENEWTAVALRRM